MLRDWSMDMVSDPIKILIVDDDEQVLIELERLLESEGYRTTTAWGGREALALSDQCQFDILLVDEDMAHPDCHAFLVELKRRQPNAGFLQMHTRKNPKDSSANAVCKWQHAEMKATIRGFLAA
jgi:DNA-binding NtrC family response regulator